VVALILVGIIFIQFIVFSAWPPPFDGSAADWFKLFEDNWLRGLLSFELLMVIYTILSIFIALALYTALKEINQPLSALYLILNIIIIAAFIAARPALEMLALSKQYAAAATQEQETILLAAGYGMQAAFNGTAFHLSYILGSISGLIISFVMLRSNIFSKSIAYIRIASSILDFGMYIPVAGIYISMFSVVFLLIWNILIARRLFKLAAN
jgi:hypothetical protein